jgi:cell division protein FtsB
MRNADFGPYLRTKRNRLKRSIKFKAFNRRINSRIYTIKNALDWGIILRIIILAILICSIALFFVIKHRADVKIQELNDTLDQTEQQFQKDKEELDSQLKDLRNKIKNLDKETKETKKLITERNRKKQVIYASVPRVSPVNNPEVSAYLLSKFASAGSYNAKVMLAVCTSESGLRNVANGVGDYGVCQIRLSAHYAIVPGNTWAEKEQSLLNPYTNINLAWVISNKGNNFYPWTDYKNGNYLKYL